MTTAEYAILYAIGRDLRIDEEGRIWNIHTGKSAEYDTNKTPISPLTGKRYDPKKNRKMVQYKKYRAISSRIVFCYRVARPVSGIVHHIDGNPENNRIENLTDLPICWHAGFRRPTEDEIKQYQQHIKDCNLPRLAPWEDP